ncbi:glycosyltransferase [Pseudomonas sp. NPDC090202]|uniref:glycosyltransferase n=1 Tax=unclassified Pseudomonas TaxID=196821 RepID=UPI0037F2D66D
MQNEAQVTIHQFAISVSVGDGISNGMFLTRKLLRQAGVKSDIYCIQPNDTLRGDVLSMDEYQPGSATALLVHHGIGNPVEGWLRDLPERKFMVFHNITPGELFPPDHAIQPMLAHGWEQVDTWKHWLTGSIADSQQNLQELLQRGYSADNTTEIPLLVDLERIEPHAVKRNDLPRPFTLLFVGRIMPHKNQLGVVEAFAQLLRRSRVPLHLYLVGGFTVMSYKEQIEKRIEELGIGGYVSVTGKVDDETLNSLYARSDLFVSLSHHEGFGMPLIEAMAHDLPVLAYDAESSNVVHTLNGAGLLMNSDEPQVVAATIAQLMENPALRRHLKRRGAERLHEFAYQHLYDRLSAFMGGFDINLPQYSFQKPVPQLKVDYRIEGPFDSTYSLALVNRELGRALAEHGHRVALRATEGPGPIAVDAAFLEANPGCAALHDRGERPANNVLRLMYPPRVSDMAGDFNVVSCYGWEESCLPQAFCHDFNHQAHLVTSMSNWVTRTLQDNGVTAPIVTVGLGADHILRADIDAGALPPMAKVTPERLKLLHVSSCFPRKGVDVLLKAYGQAFTGNDAVVLIIKTFPNPHHNIEQQVKDWAAELPSAPAVELIVQDLPDSAMRALYNLGDVLVAPSRGEGFGLPLAEAMLHKLPVIVTGQGGQSDFCTPDTAWLIDYRYERARTHLEASASVWFEPSAEHLASLLGEFHQAWKGGKLDAFTAKRVEAADALIRSRFTWSAVAKATVEAIDLAQQQPLLKKAPRLGSVTTWNSACGIATYSDKLLEPAFGQECHVFANDDALLTRADQTHVERCWTAGSTDSLERLRAAVEKSGVDTLLLQFNFSFFGIKQFASFLDWAHARGIRTLVVFHSTADVKHGEELKSLRDMRESLAGCQRLLVHSIGDMNRLKDFGLADNLLMFPHGVIDTPPPAPGPRQLAANLGSKTIIASYGFLLPHKGMPELIEAFAMLAAKDKNLHLLLVNAQYPVQASADLAETCRQRILQSDLSGRVTLITDFLSDEESLAWLGMADAIVFPYQHTQESSSAAVRWGLSTGRPVFCTPLSIFEDVSDAVTFLPGTDSHSLSIGIKAELDASPQARQEIWLRNHAWRAVSARLDNVLRAISA